MKFKKVKANSKPPTEAQKRARERNWNKAQISNIKSHAHKIYNSKTTTSNERIELGIIIDAANSILQNWK